MSCDPLVTCWIFGIRQLTIFMISSDSVINCYGWSASVGPCAKCHTKNSTRWHDCGNGNTCICERCYNLQNSLPAKEKILSYEEQPPDQWDPALAVDCTVALNQFCAPGESSHGEAPTWRLLIFLCQDCLTVQVSRQSQITDLHLSSYHQGMGFCANRGYLCWPWYFCVMQICYWLFIVERRVYTLDLAQVISSEKAATSRATLCGPKILNSLQTCRSWLFQLITNCLELTAGCNGTQSTHEESSTMLTWNTNLLRYYSARILMFWPKSSLQHFAIYLYFMKLEFSAC